MSGDERRIGCREVFQKTDMDITLKPETLRRISEKVHGGEFESADAIVEQAVTFFLDYEEEDMDEVEFRATKAAVDEAFEQAERGEGLSLEDFEKNMRAKYGIQR
jgi:Arc/MetJ-type ribon-helix-helix transcriptional regulator